VASAALPAQWTKPVIEAVVLPAHAQATGSVVVGGGGGSGGDGPGPVTAGSVGESILNFFVSPADAVQVILQQYCLELSIPVGPGGVASSVKVTKLCRNVCKSDLTNRNIAPVALSGSGANWSGTVDGLSLTLSSVNPFSNTLANANYGGISGAILKNATCSCPEDCVAD
jgi:hypothetical protein